MTNPPARASKKLWAELSRARVSHTKAKESVAKWIDSLALAKQAYDYPGEIAAEKKIKEYDMEIAHFQKLIPELEDQIYKGWDPKKRLSPDEQQELRRRW